MSGEGIHKFAPRFYQFFVLRLQFGENCPTVADLPYSPGERMDIDAIARSMRARMPWPVGQLVLRQHGLRPGQGWAKTLDKLSDSTADYSEIIEPLAASLKEHLLCGEKLVRFYEVTKKARVEMADAVSELKVPRSAFSKSYPILLSEEELADQPTVPTLVAIEETDDAVAAVFASKRVIEIREPVPKDGLPEEAVEALSDYDEIVGVRHVRYQAMDIVSISSKGNNVNVRIDYPQGMHLGVGRAGQEYVKETLHDLIKKDYLSNPINLFPLLSQMYHDHHEGSVVELAFGTETASLKRERMRRRGTCLRKEIYHKGGKAALKEPIQPYLLSIIWQNPTASDGFSRPELGLHSTSLVAGHAEPVLLDAVFRKCMGNSDFDHVKARIEYHKKNISRLLF